MNPNVLIFCLFAVANIGHVAVGGKRRVEVDGNLNSATRWQKEKSAFPSGLHIKTTENGELVIASIGRSAPTSTSLQTNDVKFLLYTRRNPKTPQTLTLNNLELLQKSHYNNQKLTIFVTHGWMNNGQSESCTKIRDAYLTRSDVNVIIVDWGAVAQNLLYPQVVAEVPNVANALSVFLRYMIGEGYLLFDNTIMVGHSLGAHVVGIAGYKTDGKARTIFGLDPALPLFQYAKPGYRISKKDAQHVQIVHTNPGMWGTDSFWGHVSFIMNGFNPFQDSCWEPTGACSHARAYQYFAESITTQKGFYGTKCGDVSELIEAATGACFGDLGRMGGILADESLEDGEVYTVPVNRNEPYAIGSSLSGWRLLGRSAQSPNKIESVALAAESSKQVVDGIKRLLQGN